MTGKIKIEYLDAKGNPFTFAETELANKNFKPNTTTTITPTDRGLLMAGVDENGEFLEHLVPSKIVYSGFGW